MRILLAVNETNDAVETARYLAHRFGQEKLEIDILSVIPGPELFRRVTGTDRASQHQIEKQQRLHEKVCSLVAGFENQIRFSAKVRSIRTYVEYGDAAEIILNFSRQLRSDLALIGIPSQQGMLTAFRVDGVTRRVLKWAECPVEMFRTSNYDTESNRILVPVRINTEGELDLPPLEKLSWSPGSHLHLMGVMPSFIEDNKMEVNQVALLLRMQEFRDRSGVAKARFSRLCEGLAQALPDEVKISHELEEGSLSEILSRKVKELTPSLVVMDEGWSSGVKGNLFSSLAPMALVLSMPCSVISLAQNKEMLQPVKYSESARFAR